ncbi:MAG: hypothetical protein ABIJ08_05750, partial [Nanoarchaeota archaeon]
MMSKISVVAKHIFRKHKLVEEKLSYDIGAIKSIEEIFSIHFRELVELFNRSDIRKPDDANKVMRKLAEMVKDCQYLKT